MAEKLEAKLRTTIRACHYKPKTEKSYVYWYKEFVRFHNYTHPASMGAPEIRQFLDHLAEERHVSPATHNQAKCAIVYLYKNVIKNEPGDFGDLATPKRKKRLPVVLSKEETSVLLRTLEPEGQYYIMAALMYGAGLRLNECLELRVKDIDFNMRVINVCDGKGGKDRTVPLPHIIIESLKRHLTVVRGKHFRDVTNGHGAVQLPNALHKKYPKASRQWIWQYIFPSDRLSTDPKTGHFGRWHIYDTTVQKKIKQAVKRSGVVKMASCHTLRHSFASHLVQDGYDIRTVQKLMGHKNIKTTMKYVHIVEASQKVQSPLDNLLSGELSGQCMRDDVDGKSPTTICGKSLP